MIDWSKVNELRNEVGAEDFDEVVTLFLSEVDETLTELCKPDRSLGEDLHFLKGCALNLGFEEFSKLCNEGEQACASGQEASVDTAAIIACYGVSKSAFFDDMQFKLAS